MGGVHGSRVAVARQLGIHGGGGGLGVHLQLQGVQRGLVGLRRQPRGEAGVQGVPSAAARSAARA